MPSWILLAASGTCLAAAVWVLVDAYCKNAPLIDDVKQQAPVVQEIDTQAFIRAWEDFTDPALAEDEEIAALNEQYGWYVLDTTEFGLKVMAKRAAKVKGA
jgi:hypothetical protein